MPEAARPPHPNFWIEPPQALSINAGENRTNWDLRYDAPPAFSHGFEINANAGLTPTSPEGALAPPGRYTLRLSANGATYAQHVTIRNDPRSPATAADLAAQHALLVKITAGMRESYADDQQAVALRAAAVAAVAASGANAPGEVTTAVAAFVARIDSVSGAARGGRGGVTFRSVNAALAGQLNAQDNADMAPNPPMLAAYAATTQELAKVRARWLRVAGADLTALNTVLVANGRAPIAARVSP